MLLVWFSHIDALKLDNLALVLVDCAVPASFMTLNLLFAQKKVVCDLVFGGRVKISLGLIVIQGCCMVHILMDLGYGQVIALSFVVIVHFELFLEVSAALRLLVLARACGCGFDWVLESGPHNDGTGAADILMLRFGILGGQQFLCKFVRFFAWVHDDVHVKGRDGGLFLRATARNCVWRVTALCVVDFFINRIDLEITQDLNRLGQSRRGLFDW